MGIGVIRCAQTEGFCGDDAALAGMDKDAVVAIANCGGCPGRKIIAHAREMRKMGADTIAFSFIGYPCPFAKRMQEVVAYDLGEAVRVMELD